MIQSTVEFSKTNVVEIVKAPPVRVLHVDDDVSFLKTARPILEMQGAFQVDTAQSVKEAVEKMKKEEYDVVVSDYLMPGKDGLQFLKELRKKGNKIPFVVFTGKGREEVAVKALNLGADGYFNKSGHPETVYGELAQGMRQVVGKRRAEQSFLKSEDKYRRLVETLREGIWVIDKDSRTTFVNPRMAEILGYDIEEMEGTHLFSFMDERGVEIAKRLLERRKQDIKEQHDFEFLRKDGKRVYATLETTPITDDNGNYSGALAGVMDITKRKKAEEELRNTKNYLDNLLNYANAPIIVWDNAKRITLFNNAFEALTGHKKKSMLGRNIGILFPPSQKEAILQTIESATKGEKWKSVEIPILCKDKETKIALWNSTNITDEEGKMVATIAQGQDITERKKVLEKLRVLNEKLNVVGNLTRHDVRNKLFTVTNNIYLAKQLLPDDHKALAYLREIESACGRTKRILDFAATYESLGVEQLVPVDMGKAVEEAASLFSDLQGVKVVNECHGLGVIADSLLSQLFYNMIDNSLKHGKKVSQIRIHFEEGKKELKLFYEDNGVGIPKAIKPKLFDEGFTTGNGQGCGLLLIRKMMEIYSWAIKEEGKPGKGVKFVIAIPKTNPNGKENYQLS